MKTIVKKIGISMVLAFMFGVIVKAQTVIYKGDVNLDNAVDAADISSIIDIMAKDIKEPIPIMVRDTIFLKDIPHADKTPEGVEPVDMGLPSGTRWANMNIGAGNKEEAGYYFAWGDIEGHEEEDTTFFKWDNYKWMKEGESSWKEISRYNVYDGQTEGQWLRDGWKGDNWAVLHIEDDAARMNWGGYWRMPSKEDFEELITYCTLVFDKEKCGLTFTSKINSESIFFPAAGYKGDGLVEGGGYYWSSSLFSTHSARANSLCIGADNCNVSGRLRFFGQSVRPVRKD